MIFYLKSIQYSYTKTPLLTKNKMKILKKLKIQNFLNTGNREIDFTKTKDVTLIVGGNTKGKTTILRAIYMCLTGQDAFFGNKNIDSLIRNGENKMLLELSLEKGDSDILVRVKKKRGEKERLDIEIFLNEVRLNQSLLVTDAKNILEDLFGDANTILQTYFFFSNHDEDFVSATPTRRLEMITKNTAIFEEYNNISQQAALFAKELTSSIDVLQGRLLSNEETHKLKEDKYFSLLEEVEKLTGNSTYNETLISQLLEETQEEIVQLRDIVTSFTWKNALAQEIEKTKQIDIVQLQKKLEESEKNEIINEKTQKDIKKLQKDLEESHTRLLEYTQRMSKKETELGQSATVVKIESQHIQKLPENFVIEGLTEKLLEEKVEELSSNNERLSDIVSKGKDIASFIKVKENELEETQEIFQHNKSCPVCHSELTEKALASYKERIKAEITEKIKEKEQLTEEYKALTSKITEMEAFIRNAEIFFENIKIETKISSYKEKITELEEEIAKIKNALDIQKNEYKESQEKKQNLEKKLLPVLSASDKVKISEQLKEVAGMQEKIAEFNTLKETLANIDEYETKEKIQYAERKIKSISIIQHDIKTLSQEIKESIKSVEEIKTAITTTQKEIQQYKNLSKWYGKNGIQKKQLEIILRNIEFESNAVISKFFDNISVKFGFDGSGISLVVERQFISSDGQISYLEDTLRNFSDAQQEILRVILKVFLSKASQYMNKKPLNMIFFNETFNKLSEDKEMELKKILDFFAQEHQVVFVTHNKNILSYFEQDSIIAL